jgi:hypothetical protein
MRYKVGTSVERQLVQLLTFSEHVLQGFVHGVHFLLMGMVVAGQFVWQVLPSKFSVLQEVQLVLVTSQVAQSPWQASAIPLIFTYPLGVVARQSPPKATNPRSHFSQNVLLIQ